VAFFPPAIAWKANQPKPVFADVSQEEEKEEEE
jgi:hypothetical protein